MIGDLGENLASVFLSRKTTEGHLFRTAVIGGKWPTIDMYAEVITDTNSRMFCFFQIKTTDQGYTKKQHHLQVSVELNDLVRLSQYCAPSYLIGIDHNSDLPFQSKAYIATVRGNQTRRLSSFPTKHILSEENLIALRNEVILFWSKLDPLANKENYFTKFDYDK